MEEVVSNIEYKKKSKVLPSKTKPIENEEDSDSDSDKELKKKLKKQTKEKTREVEEEDEEDNEEEEDNEDENEDDDDEECDDADESEITDVKLYNILRAFFVDDDNISIATSLSNIATELKRLNKYVKKHT